MSMPGFYWNEGYVAAKSTSGARLCTRATFLRGRAGLPQRREALPMPLLSLPLIESAFGGQFNSGYSANTPVPSTNGQTFLNMAGILFIINNAGFRPASVLPEKTDFPSR